jgi:peptidoglycan hydrolase-like protein with peptidoglycan-binding domain
MALQRGDTGAAVLAAQVLLRVPRTGTFDAITELAVVQLQQKFSLAVNGILDTAEYTAARHASSHETAGADPVSASSLSGVTAFGASLIAAANAAAARTLLGAVAKAGDTMTGLLTAQAGIIDSTVVSGEILIAHTLGRIKSSSAFLFDWSTGNITHVGDFKTNKVGAGTDPAAAAGTKLVAGTSAGNFGSSTAVAHFIDNTVNATVNFQNTNAAGYTAFDLFNSAGTKVVTYAWSNASAGLYPNALWFMTRIAGDMILGTNNVERLRLSASGVTIGAAGTALSQAKVYTPTLTPALIAGLGLSEETFTVTGLATTDTIALNGPAPTAGVAPVAWRVSAANTLAITFQTTAVSLTPAAGVYRVIAFRS